ncbi:MAG: 3'(2'),5'-bisphosphate nucleotidase CysQ [Blastocatellia bacterium]
MGYLRELDIAMELARNAGRLVMEFRRRGVVAESKLGVDSFVEPVTEADRAASEIIMSGLQRAFPKDSILSEEATDPGESRLANNRVWIIDPIDGTAGFIRDDGDFAVQIGLAVAGRPAVGVVYLPSFGKLYFAASQIGCWSIDATGKKRRHYVSDKSDFSKVSVAVSRNHRSPRISTIIEKLGLGSEVQRGSVGLKIGLIAEQETDLYIHLSPRTKSWDTCAPEIILTEAGGKLTDLWGGQYRYDLSDVQNHGGIVASNQVIHARVVELLAPILEEFGRRPNGDGNQYKFNVL